jgi:WD40 repeat protein
MISGGNVPDTILYWDAYISDTGRCRISAPSGSNRFLNVLPGGVELVTWELERRDTLTRFFYAHYRLPQDDDRRPEVIFDAECRSVLDGFPGSTLENSTPRPWKGYPGCQYLVTTASKERLILRLVLVHGDVFLLGARAAHYRPDSRDVIRFFDSFDFVIPPSRWQPDPGNPPPIPIPPAEDKAIVYLKGRFLTTNRRPAHAAALSPDGRFIAVGQGGRPGWPSLVVWELARKEIETSALHQLPSRAVRSVAFDPDGILLAAGDELGEVHLVEWPAGTTRHSSLTGHTQPVEALYFSPDGRTLVSLSSDTLLLHDTVTGKVEGRFPTVGSALAYRPDGERLVSAAGTVLVVHDPRTGKELSRHPSPDNKAIRAVVFSRDGKSLLTATEDEIRWWTSDMKPDGMPLRLQGADIQRLAFSPDGRFVSVGGEPGLWVVETATRRQLQKLDDLRRVSSLLWASDGKMLVVTTLDGATHLLDATDLLKLPR